MKRIILLASVLGFAASLAASAAEPKDTWAASCARCHGADGKGQTAMGRLLGAKDYTDPTVQAALTDDAAFKAVKEGLTDQRRQDRDETGREPVGQRHQGARGLHADF